MDIRRTEEFRNETVRIVLTSGLSLKQISDDLGIGLLTLGKWVAALKHDELISVPRMLLNWPVFAKRTNA